MSVQPLKTILFLAPSAAGKSTAVRELLQSGDAHLHLDRDEISWKIKSDYRAAAGLCGPLTPDVLGRLHRQGYEAYDQTLANALVNRTSDIIVIDFVPLPLPRGWAEKTIRDCHQHGRSTHLEGLHINPELGLQRIMHRNTKGQDMTGKQPAIATDRRYFESWLQSYKHFPRQFMDAAAIADTAVLHDVSAPEKTVIARWDKGVCTVIDQKAFDAFLNLKNIALEAATFSITKMDTQTVDGVLVHDFTIDTSRFFGADVPTEKLAKQSPGIANTNG